MKLAIVSDLHLGDPFSLLVPGNGGEVGPKYDDFIHATGNKLDFLILAGDVFDFSIENKNTVMKNYAKPFFQKLKRDGIAKNYIFIPGNHDYEMWDIIRTQADTINPMISGKDLKDYRHSCPGILDLRKNNVFDAFTIPNVTKKTDGKPYGDLFLDYLTTDENGKSTSTFYIVYPNLYLITPKNETYIVTHGHYFETYWSLLSSWAPSILKEKLDVSLPFDLADLVAINHPLCLLSCSGTGQAGPLTQVINEVQRQTKDKELDDIKKYLDNFGKEIDKKGKYGISFWNEIIEDTAISSIKKMIIKALEKGYKPLKDNPEQLFTEDTIARMNHFFKSSKIEIEDLKRYANIDIPFDDVSLIFGHTHNPIEIYQNRKQPSLKNGLASNQLKIPMFNTGGWLKQKKDKKVRHGGGVYKYDSKNKSLEYAEVDVY